MIRSAAIVPILATSALAVISCITNPSLGTGETRPSATSPDPVAAPSLSPTADAGLRHDASVPAQPTLDAGGGSTHSASCAALLSAMLASPLAPPNRYAG